MPFNVVVDVWGGRNSTKHVARAMLSLDLALKMTEQELHGGFLVSLRKEIAWGSLEDFDIRQGGRKI